MKIRHAGRRAGGWWLALAPLALWLAASQQPGTPDKPVPPPVVPAEAPSNRFSDEVVVARLQGAWQLERVVLPGRDAPRDPEVGYLLVSGDYLALEIHGYWFDERRRMPDDRSPTKLEDVLSGAMQTGVHRFEIDPSGAMTTRSLIGTNYLEKGRYEFEPPGTERKYRIEVSGGRLELSTFEGRRLSFRRLQHGSKERDIFGRPRPSTEPAPTPEDPEEVERDIYGRPIKKPAKEGEPE